MNEHTRAFSLVVFLVLVASAPVRADPDDERWPNATSFARLSLGVGTRDVGDTTTKLGGFGLAVGHSGTAWSLYGEGRIGHQTDGKDDTLSALSADASVHVRRHLARLAMKDGVMACGIDLGLGVQRTQWSDGGFTRPMVSVGVGGGMDLRTKRGRWMGIGLELRLDVAPSIGWDRELARCTDGCAMRTDRYDLGFTLLAHFPFSLGEAP